MAALPPLRQIVNNTPADAVDVNWNFQTLGTQVSTEVINRDGSVAMVAPLTVPAGTAPTHAVNLGQLEQNIPTGVIWPFAGATAPAGFAFCNGAVQSRTDPAYADLFAAIGTAYNTSGEGSGNFRLPDLRGSFPMGPAGTVGEAIGDRGGDKDAVIVSHKHTMGTHVHTMPSHNHTLGNHNHTMGHTHVTNVGTGYTLNSVKGTKGDASGWSTSATGVLYGSAPSVNSALGSTVVSGSPGGWFNQTIAISIGNKTSGGSSSGSTGSDNGNTGSKDPGNTNSTDPGDTNTTGSSGTNKNLPPYLCLNFVIRL